MADEKGNKGGARPGAGRKPKALEDDLRYRLQKALKEGCAGQKSRLDAIFTKLVDDCTSDSFKTRQASRALLFDRLYGKVTTPVTDEGDQGDGTFVVRVPVRMSAEEWQKQVKPSEPPSSQ
jgi:hypothetical protein